MLGKKSVNTKDDICQTFCFNEKVVNRLKGKVKEVNGLAEIFKALGDDTRAKIVYALSREELCVCDIASILGLSVSTISHHLRVLRNLKLVRYRKDGKIVFYSLDDSHIFNLIAEGIKHIGEERGGGREKR